MRLKTLLTLIESFPSSCRVIKTNLKSEIKQSVKCVLQTIYTFSRTPSGLPSPFRAAAMGAVWEGGALLLNSFQRPHTCKRHQSGCSPAQTHSLSSPIQSSLVPPLQIPLFPSTLSQMSKEERCERKLCNIQRASTMCQYQILFSVCFFQSVSKSCQPWKCLQNPASVPLLPATTLDQTTTTPHAWSSKWTLHLQLSLSGC